MARFNQTNNNSNSVVELENKKGDNMELVDVNVVVECGNPQYAIGSDKIIGYEELEVCGECGAIIRSKTHKYCTQCGTQVREVKTSQPTIKVLNLTTEQFEELIDKEVFFIEYGIRLVRDENTKVQYQTTEEVLEKINELIGVLNIKEAKEFVFQYGDRRNENKEIYDELLLEKIQYSDEVVDKQIQIEEIRLEDYNDWGIKCGGLLIGYNIQY